MHFHQKATWRSFQTVLILTDLTIQKGPFVADIQPDTITTF